MNDPFNGFMESIRNIAAHLTAIECVLIESKLTTHEDIVRRVAKHRASLDAMEKAEFGPKEGGS